MNKRRFSAVLMIAVLLLGCLTFSPPRTACAGGNVQVSAAAKSFTSVRVSWKKKSGATRYKIYRKTASAKKFKRIATVKGKKKSYKDKKCKKNKTYIYRVRAYKGKKRIATGISEKVTTGLPVPYWFDYQGCDTAFSPSMIELRFDAYGGVPGDGFSLERRVTGGTYKVLKTQKAKTDRQMRFVDRRVTPGTEYQYRVRIYKKYKGKIRYGAYSSNCREAAVNKTAKYNVSVKEGTGGGSKTMVILLKSHKYNAVTRIDSGVIPFASEGAAEAGYDDDEYALAIAAISTDGKKYQKCPKKIVLRPGGQIWLKLSDPNGNVIPACKKQAILGGEDESYHVDYHYYECFFSLDLIRGTGYAYIDAEMIH